ncbi:MAG: DUF4397 domain-containing protein [Acidimicrobiales bacterium]
MRKILLSGLIALLALVGLTTASAPAGAVSSLTTPGKVTLVHGIPGANGFPVDITVSRSRTNTSVFRGVTYGTVAGPLDLLPGTYSLAIRVAGSSPISTPALAGTLKVAAGSNQSVVAHLTEAGSPTVSIFQNDVSPTGAGNARVTVRHLAQAPAVDVIVNGSLELISALSNPGEATAVVPAATYDVRVTDAGTNTVTAFQGDLSLAANSTTIVYAVGSLGGGSFTPLVQVLPAG